MTTGEKIKALRTENNMTLEEFGNLVGVGKSTVRKWEAGEIKNMGRDKIARLSLVFRVSPTYLISEEAEKDQEPAPAPVQSEYDAHAVEEKRLVTLWRRADEIDQSTIWNILRRYETDEAEPQIIYIRHYLVPAAAGYASAIEGEDYELIELPADAPRGADFCISISGDSMEPYIHDGEMVYVKRGAELHDFEPGIFFVDGNVYCKQYCPGYAGEFYLLSANPMREDANIIVRKDDGKTCFYFGKVLLKMRLPEPRYY